MNSILGFFASFKTTIIVGAVAFVVGFGAGIYTLHKFNKAGVANELEKKAVADAKSVNASNGVELKIIEGKDAIDTKYEILNKEIIKYVPKTIYKECKAADNTVVSTTLSTNAVGVLNGESSADVQSASVGDAEVETASEIGLLELSEHIAEIKKQYEELAVAHDGLVDYNTEYKLLIKQ